MSAASLTGDILGYSWPGSAVGVAAELTGAGAVRQHQTLVSQQQKRRSPSRIGIHFCKTGQNRCLVSIACRASHMDPRGPPAYDRFRRTVPSNFEDKQRI